VKECIKMKRLTIGLTVNLPHDLDFFPVLELVRGGVGACVLAADERAVDAVGFNGGDCGAVLY